MTHSATFGAKAWAYIRRIDSATHAWELDEIAEHSAWDTEITPEEYLTIYKSAQAKYWHIVGED